MTTKTDEELRNDMIDALEAVDDAARVGIVLSNQATSALYAMVTETSNAVLMRDR